jgi:hypothetical protein
MDYSCHQCGMAIPEGTAFCPHCGAPQIRVSVPEPDTTSAAPASPSFAPGTPGEMQPPARPVNLTSFSSNGIDWTNGRLPIVMSGIFIGITSFLPLQFLWIPAGGFLAVHLYNKRTFRRATSPSEGAKIGAMAGLAGYLIFAVGMLAVFRFAADMFWNPLMEAMRARGASTGSDIGPVLDILKSPQGKAFFATFVMAVAFALILVLAAIGGAVSAAYAARRS